MADEMIDGFAQHTVNILRVEAGARAKALQALLDLEGNILGKVATASNVNQQARLQALLSQTQGSIQKAYSLIEKNHLRDMRGLAGLEAKATTKIINRAIGVDIMSVAVTPKLLESVVDEKIIMGNSSGEWWKKQSSDLQFKFGNEMRMGILSGEPNDELMKRVRGTKANDYNDGIMSTSRREAAALVRSSAIATSNAARIKSLEEMGDVVKGIQWVSTLDGRTTLICVGLSGLAWRLPDYEPIGHSKAWPGPTAHWNCRSTQVPVLRSWEELAGQPMPTLDGKELNDRVQQKLAAMGMSPEQMAQATRDTRASMDGQVPKNLGFDGWLNTKSDPFIDKLLGPGRAKLWNRGKGQVALSELTDQTNRPLTLAQLADFIENGADLPETLGVSYFALDPAGKYIEAADVLEAIPDAAEQAAQAAQMAADEQAKLDIEAMLAGGATKLELQAAEAALAAGKPMNAATLAEIKAAAAAKQALQNQSATIAKAKANFLAGKPLTPAQLKVLDGLDPAAKADYLDTWAQLKTAADAKAAAAALTAEALTKVDELAEAVGQYNLSPEQIKLLMALPADVQKQVSAKATAIQVAAATAKAETTLNYIITNDSVGLDEWATGAMDAAGVKFVQDTLDALPDTNAVKVKFMAAVADAKKLAGNKNFVAALTDAEISAYMANPDAFPDLSLIVDSLGADPVAVEFFAKMNALEAAALAAADAAKAVTFVEGLTNSQLVELHNGDPFGTDPLVLEFWKQFGVLGQDHPTISAAFDKMKVLDALSKAAPPVPIPAPAKKPRTRKPKASTVAPPVPLAAVADVPALDAIIPADFPTDPAKLKLVRRLGGSTGAELVEDTAGRRYVRKGGASADHVRSEFAADRIYAAFGLDVPRGALYNATGNSPVKLTEFIEGKEFSSLTGKAKADAIEALKKGFAVDALLGNWDVVGMSGDNVLWTGTRALRIDNGGALSYRAQGGLKSADEWNEYPLEIHSMRESAQGKGVFGSLSIYDIARQAEILNEAAVDAAGLDANTTAMVKARLVQLKAVAERARRFETDKFKPAAFDTHARQMLAIRKAGIDQNLLGATTRTGTIVKDAKTGAAFGNLRTAGKAASGYASQDPWYNQILAAVKTVNNHHTKGTVANVGTINSAMGFKKDLSIYAINKGPQQAMAKAYLDTLNELEPQLALATAGKTPSKLMGQFQQVQPAGPAPAAPTGTSVLTQLHAELEKQLVAKGMALTDARKATKVWLEWTASQGGNSWTDKPVAAKYWMAKQRDVAEADNYWGGMTGNQKISKAKSEFDKMAKAMGGEENLDLVFHGHHALMQEQLALVDVDYNDRNAKVLLLLRTDDKTLLGGDTGDIGTMTRGATESHSIFNPTYVFAGSNARLTVQAVPHSRVLWSYWFERNEGQGGAGFLGDGENEFAADTSKIPFRIFGKVYSHPVPASNKLADWKAAGIPTDHL